MVISKIEEKRHLRKWSIMLVLLSLCTAFVWPCHLSSDRAFAAVNSAFTVKPHDGSVQGSLVEERTSPTVTPVSFHYAGTTYRATHQIQQLNENTDSWSNVSTDVTEDQNPSADGYQVDHITAVATGDVWYVGTLVGNVVVGSPSANWRQVSTGLPERSVTAIAEMKGDSQVAAVGYAGYASATPDTPGHVYVTLDGGLHWFDITGNLPDAPVQALRFSNTKNAFALEVKMASQWYESTKEGQWQAVDATGTTAS